MEMLGVSCAVRAEFVLIVSINFCLKMTE